MERTDLELRLRSSPLVDADEENGTMYPAFGSPDARTFRCVFAMGMCWSGSGLSAYDTARFLTPDTYEAACAIVRTNCFISDEAPIFLSCGGVPLNEDNWKDVMQQSWYEGEVTRVWVDFIPAELADA